MIKSKINLILFISVLIISVFAIKVIFYNNKSNLFMLDEVTLREYINNSDGLFAIMVENDDGEYVEYTDSTSWPTGMVFNISMSGCIDNNGNTLDNVLSFKASSNTVSVSTSETSFCYLYFDYLCDENEDIANCLINSASINGGNDETLIEHTAGCDNGCAEDGHYRYSGADEDVNNYICFGTSDLDTCFADTDTYLFRIIEINPEDGAIKIVSANSYGLYFWNSTDFTSDTAIAYGSYYNYWAVDNTLYSTLAYILNTTYLENFDENWQDIIINYSEWGLGSVATVCMGYPTYAITSECYAKSFYDSVVTTTATFKIGLINIYDYAYSSNNWLELVGSTSSKWMGSIGWTITRNSSVDTVYCTDGSIFSGPTVWLATMNVYPTFYIDGINLTYLAGSGTETGPIVVTYN